jgi:SRSO17 transposase
MGFATKPRIAVDMIKRALSAEVPFTWLAADTVYGVGEVEQVLRQAGKGYVLGVTGAHQVRSWGKARPVVGHRRSNRRISADGGLATPVRRRRDQGPRLHEWCYVELADLEASEYGGTAHDVWTRGLLIRRHIADGALAFFSTWCPAGTPIAKLVAVEGHRRAIEDSFETTKNELGLDHNETRSWHGWHRHVSLVMLAFAMLATIRHHANASPGTPKKPRSRRPRLWPAGRSRKSGA